MANFDSNRFKSKGQSWETPDSLFRILDSEFHFERDLCADEKNTKCHKYYTERDNALMQDWKGVCWLNPPYGAVGFKLKDWVKKSWLESQKHNSTIVMLIPARTNTNWWHEYCMTSSEIRFIKGRPKFKGCVHGLPQPLVIVIFKGQDKKAKLSTFELNESHTEPQATGKGHGDGNDAKR